MGHIINNVRKALNWVSIQATGLNGNSFSKGKIGKMQDIANIYANATNSHTLLTAQNKSDIAYKIKELGQSGELKLFDSAPTGKYSVNTRSAVVMAVFIAYISKDIRRIPPNIDELNADLKFYLDIDYDLIENNSDTNSYLKEATAFINEGYKSITSSNQDHTRDQLHDIFSKMGGIVQIGLIETRNWKKVDIKSNLLSVEELNRLNETDGNIVIDYRRFVISLHYNKFFDKRLVSSVFQKLDSATRVAIVTLVHKHQEYAGIDNIYNFFNRLTENEKNEVQKELSKGAILREYTMGKIKNLVDNPPKSDSSNKYNEAKCKEFIDNLIEPVKNLTDLKSRLLTFNQTEELSQVDEVSIEHIISYLFSEPTEKHQKARSNPEIRTGTRKHNHSSGKHVSKNNRLEEEGLNSNKKSSSVKNTNNASFNLLDIDDSDSEETNNDSSLKSTASQSSVTTKSTVLSNINSQSVEDIPHDMETFTNSNATSLQTALNNKTTNTNDDEIELRDDNHNLSSKTPPNLSSLVNNSTVAERLINSAPDNNNSLTFDITKELNKPQATSNNNPKESSMPVS